MPATIRYLNHKATAANEQRQRIRARFSGGRGRRVLKVSDPGWPCHEFKPSTTKDPLCRAAMHAKSVES
ncbi:hypothetical protein TNCV_2250581 [Trichonephila clavipes]|nr:hypothetical protein TNCV_2250581 [Trichonephila clavipes]